MNYIGWFMGLIVGYVFGILALAFIVATSTPDCPTEDSCMMVRENGHSKIVEVTP